MPGGVANEQMIPDAKTRIATSHIFDLSTAIASGAGALLLYDKKRPLVITGVSLVYVTETMAATSTINIGTQADEDALVDAYVTSASATVGTAVALPLATTLNTYKTGEARWGPVLPANTALMWINSASGGAGQVQAVIYYFPLDVNNAL